MSAMAPEVFVACITSATAVVVALISTRRTGVATRRIEGKVDEVHESTVNSHQTNMRQDLDAVYNKVHVLTDSVERIEGAQANLGALVARLAREQTTANKYVREHDAASALVVAALKRRDDELADELHQRDHPDES